MFSVLAAIAFIALVFEFKIGRYADSIQLPNPISPIFCNFIEKIVSDLTKSIESQQNTHDFIQDYS